MSFTLDIRFIWSILGLSVLLSIVIYISRFYTWEPSQFILISTVILATAAWIIVLMDIVGNPVYRKGFWVMFMILFPTFTPFIYLIQRTKLIQMGSR